MERAGVEGISSMASKQHHRSTILVVHGEAWLEDILRLVERMGYPIVRLSTVRDLSAAFSAGSGGEFAAVIVPWTRATQEEILALHQCNRQWPSLPLVVATLGASPLSITEIVEAGASALLHWPGNMEEVRRALSTDSSSFRDEKVRGCAERVSRQRVFNMPPKETEPQVS